ncbi:MAG TPA: hypothetical protein DCQ06_12105 [Myxococcales bacterium]|nr:hypothetical protein [Myxococcales bacterium]HAN32329.1 hypothetical protein [Myxococcales bacterium]
MANDKTPFSKDFAYLWPFLQKVAEYRPEDVALQDAVSQAQTACQTLEASLNAPKSHVDSTAAASQDEQAHNPTHEAEPTSPDQAQPPRGWTVGELKGRSQGES